VKLSMTALCTLGLLCACASSRPDHFYILSAQPQAAPPTRTTPSTQATLKVTLPSLVDRSEMILNTSPDGITVLEHERWAAPLVDLVTQTLAQDLEQRRGDLLVAGHHVSRAGGTPLSVTVDVVQMSVRRGGRASIEAHWRMTDAHSGKEVVGGDVFSAPLGSDDYAAIAQAVSECLGLLADRLLGQMP
jgi:uncharacterized protein